MRKFILDEKDVSYIFSISKNILRYSLSKFDSLSVKGIQIEVGKLLGLSRGTLANSILNKNGEPHYLSEKSLKSFKKEVLHFFSSAPASAFINTKFSQKGFDEWYKAIFLKEVAKKTFEKNFKIEKRTALPGKYLVIYTDVPGTSSFKEDQLSVIQGSNGLLIAEYKHIQIDDTEEEYVGKGIPNYEARNLSLLLKPSINKNDKTIIDQSNSVVQFLTINIPPRNIYRIEVLTGILTSVRDSRSGVIARIVLLARISETTSKIYISKKAIRDFFSSHQSECCAKPPNLINIFSAFHLKVGKGYEGVTRELQNSVQHRIPAKIQKKRT